MNWSSRWSPLRIIIFILLKCVIMEETLATEETLYSRLIVAASHTALSGDLEVFILNLPDLQHTNNDQLTTPIIQTTKIKKKKQTKLNEAQKDEEEKYDEEVEEDEEEEQADIVMEQEEGDEEGEIDNDDYDSWKAPLPPSPPVTKNTLVLRVMRLDGFTSELVGEMSIETWMIQDGNASLTVPCGFFSRGGAYSLQLQRSSTIPNLKFQNFNNDILMHTTLDVRWPTPSLTLEPQHFNTYPDQAVLATLDYDGISCAPAPTVPVDNYSLQLIYCGASVLSCDPRNKSNVQMLYSEEVTGFPAQKILNLRCEFFGLAGHYALRLKPADVNSTAPTTSAYIKVETSSQYVFNVHARSVYPCDGSSGGLSVLFEYPSCRLQGDRVRVYGRLRADVASMAPPSTLHYVAELKAPPGKHTLTFDCEIFTEKFVEYCFVYVSQAINNAMAEVRVDCIPTFPLQESDAGGWGEWSQWSPCSSTCVGGVKNRYRFCDTPPPRYGAKFCVGDAVETESCGGINRVDLNSNWTTDDWECNHGKGLAADRPEVTAEIGTKCRCGCLINIKNDTSRKILAASTQACPGRSFWLIQTEPDYNIKLQFDQTKFPCTGQYVRARDGDSLSAQLLADINIDKNSPQSGTIYSTDSTILLEFFSDEIVVAKTSCVGGFLAHATIYMKPQVENATVETTMLIGPKVMAAAGRWAMLMSPAHLVAASLLLFMFILSIFLALQYAVKYRKYQVAEDLDSLTDNSACSGSMQGLTRRARAISSSTLISEVVSLVRLPRRNNPSGHGRLEETTADLEDGYESTETQAECEDDQSIESIIPMQKDNDENTSQKTIIASSKSTPSRRSSTSSTITSSGQPEVKYARPVKLRTVGPISPVSEEASMSEDSRRCSTASGSTSGNNVSVSPPKSSILQAKSFSPASTSSNISTLRCGKETKDRRNRERLLQGPGSEFSLVNQDTDLELDYYDYNVVNAGAAPGSYLGMDPAFLVWIPPLDHDEDGIIDDIKEDHHYEEIPERRCDERDLKLPIDNQGGTSLTPAEYKRMMSTKTDDYNLSIESPIPLRRLEPGESRLHDEIINEYRARLSEGLLPIHRILEESRVRVSEESLSKNTIDEQPIIDVIPNRLINDDNNKFTPKLTRDRIIEEHERPKSATNINYQRYNYQDDDKLRTPASIRNKLQEFSDSSSKTNKSLTDIAKINLTDLTKVSYKVSKKNYTSNDYEGDYCDDKDEFILPKLKIQNIQCRLKDMTDFNTTDINNIQLKTENIQLKELNKNKYESPIKVHNKTRDKFIKKQIQSPDYGVEVDIKKNTSESFYDFIGDDDDGAIKFADDDDDDYIDNKITACN